MTNNQIEPGDLYLQEAMKQAYEELEHEYVTEKKEKWWKRLRPVVSKRKDVHGSNIRVVWTLGIKWRW